MVSASGEVAIRAGVAGQSGDQDGVGPGARFRSPSALAVVEPANRSIAGLAWVNGSLFAALQNAVVRIAPVS